MKFIKEWFEIIVLCGLAANFATSVLYAGLVEPGAYLAYSVGAMFVTPPVLLLIQDIIDCFDSK